MEKVALKIQRRRYSKGAVFEVSLHKLLRRELGECPDIIALREAFLHDGHVCMAYEKHGRSLDAAIDRGPLPLARVKRVTGELLRAIERMHRCGYAHTDIKPDNILYDARTGTARLADLGSADNRFKRGSTFGTREYMVPELIIGAPLSTAVDLWSLGCTVFEMLTGRRLFSPRKAAAKKYREFSRDEDAIETPLAESVKADEAAEKAEQFKPGTIIAGKYALEKILGSGRYGTVWLAQQLNNNPFDGTYATLWGYASSLPGSSSIEGQKNPAEEKWRDARGADDLLDLTLNYEHLLEMIRLRGPLPPPMIQSALYRTAYFEEDGSPRFRPTIRRTSLRALIQRLIKLPTKETDIAADFLADLLSVDPSARSSASVALAHPWLRARANPHSETALTPLAAPASKTRAVPHPSAAAAPRRA